MQAAARSCILIRRNRGIASAMRLEQVIEQVLAELPKVRELEAAVRDCGCELLPDRGKGSHKAYRRPEYPMAGMIVIPGRSGSDAKRKSKQHVVDMLREIQAVARERK